MINVVGAYITKNNSFLITKRAHGELSGTWEFPGGKVESGESHKDAIKREIKEELSLDIIPFNPVGAFTHNYPNISINLTLIHCELENKEQEIKFDGSHTEYKWIKLSEESHYEFAPLDRKIIQHLHTLIK